MLRGQLSASTLRPYVLFPRIDSLALYPPILPSIRVIGFTADHTLVCSSGIHFRSSRDDAGNLRSPLKRNQASDVWITPSQYRQRWWGDSPETPFIHLEANRGKRKRGWPSAAPGRVDAIWMAMAPRQPLNYEQKRLLRITAQMPLASVANLDPVLGLDEERIRRILARPRLDGWAASVLRGMTERRQHRFFLTSQAVNLLYTTYHRHPSLGRSLGLSALPRFTRKASCPKTTGNVSTWTTRILYIGRTRKALSIPTVNSPKTAGVQGASACMYLNVPAAFGRRLHGLL